LIIGHDDHAAVTARVADMRQTDAGVTRRALHHRAGGHERTASLGVEHDRAGRTILDRTAGIHEFGLA